MKYRLTGREMLQPLLVPAECRCLPATRRPLSTLWLFAALTDTPPFCYALSCPRSLARALSARGENRGKNKKQPLLLGPELGRRAAQVSVD